MADQANDPTSDDSAGPELSEATRDEERREASAAHEPDEIESEESLRDAPDGPVSRSVAEAEKESARLGANVKGEGQITP